AFVFTNDIIIAPRESIILAEALTHAQFQNWWGLSSLPTNLQVITYQGAGLSFAVTGDGVRLWSEVAGSETDTLARVDFGASANGVSFNYNPETEAFGQPSLLGTNGVFKASSSTDIGSPGRIR